MDTTKPAKTSLMIVPLSDYITPSTEVRWTDIRDVGNRFSTNISVYAANNETGREATEAMAKRIIKALAVLDAIEMDAPKTF